MVFARSSFMVNVDRLVLTSMTEVKSSLATNSKTWEAVLMETSAISVTISRYARNS